MDDTAQERLRQLADRLDIVDCLRCYTQGMDRLDRDLVRSAHHHHDDAVDASLVTVTARDRTDISDQRPLVIRPATAG